MNLVDSSAWLAYFTAEKNAKHFINAIEDVGQLLVPSIVLYEVTKKILSSFDEELAALYAGHMRMGNMADLDEDLALAAADLSVKHHMSMADSIILATAQMYDATIWTQDADFKGMERVKYFKK